MNEYKAKDFNDAYLEWAYGSGRRDPRFINWKSMRRDLFLGLTPVYIMVPLLLIGLWLS